MEIIQMNDYQNKIPCSRLIAETLDYIMIMK